MSTTLTLRVDGMTCGHCVTTVTDAVRAVDGVEAVAVDLARGSVTVTSTRPLDPDAVAAVVVAAGYEVLS